MHELYLTRCDVTGIRQLLVVDADDDERERWVAVLHVVSRLFPSDSVGIAVVDGSGCVERALTLADGAGSEEHPRDARTHGGRDTLQLRFPLGGGHVVRLWLERASRRYERPEVTLLWLLEPAIGRLLRPSLAAGRLSELSSAERRVLTLVAAGGSNGDVATQLRVSEATVRKHLEHTYRKLGVSNRTAAAALVHVDASA